MSSKGKSYLSSGSGVNLALLREFIRRSLLELVDNAGGGKKALVIDQSLIGLLGLIVEFSALKDRGVDKMYPLEEKLPADAPPVIMYLTRPQKQKMRFIANHIKNHLAGGVEKSYNINFVPRKTIIAERELEAQGVYANVDSMNEFQLNLVPLDSDLMSMEMPTAFKDCVLHSDRTALYYAAHALMQLQVVYGIIPTIVYKGALAEQVAEVLIKKRKEQPEQSLVSPEFDSVVIIDRTVDPITPLCSQLTYEGFIDELYGIQNNLLEIPTEVREAGANGKPQKVELNSGDQLYAEVRDLNFEVVGNLLSSRSRAWKQEMDERHAAKTVSQIKQFTSKLHRLQDEGKSLNLHADIAMDVKKTATSDTFLRCLDAEQTFLCGIDTDKSNELIEDLINQKQPLFKVLRLICLQSIANGGFKDKLLRFYKKEILQTYGHEHCLTLDNLEAAGLLRIQDGKSTFPLVRKSFHLVVEEVQTDMPQDISYVYSGYAPLSVRIAEQLARPGGEGLRVMEEVLGLLPGPHRLLRQSLPPGLKPKGYGDDDGARQSRQPVTLVFFIGGCTSAEVSALRFLSQQQGRDYVIATTSVVNGNSLLKSISEDISPIDVRPPRKD